MRKAPLGALFFLLLAGCGNPFDLKQLVTTVRDGHEAFDPPSGTWSPRPSLPFQNPAETGVVGASGRLYILGGGSSFAFRYDSTVGAQGSWEILPGLPEPRSGAVAVAVSQTVVVASGIGAAGPIPFIELFDGSATPALPWTRIPTPFARFAAAVVATSNALYVIGGIDESSATRDDIWQLQPVSATGTWTRTGRMLFPRAATGSFLLGTNIHVISGHSGDFVPRLDEDVINVTSGQITTTTAAPIPTARLVPQVVVIADRAFVYDTRLGGLAPSGFLDSYTDASGWTSLASHPAPLLDSSMSAFGSQIMVAGGLAGESQGQVHVYDLPSNTWTSAGGLFDRRYGGLLITVGGTNRYLGGYQTLEESKSVNWTDYAF